LFDSGIVNSLENIELDCALIGK
jgi:hypothetical protein